MLHDMLYATEITSGGPTDPLEHQRLHVYIHQRKRALNHLGLLEVLPVVLYELACHSPCKDCTGLVTELVAHLQHQRTYGAATITQNIGSKDMQVYFLGRACSA